MIFKKETDIWKQVEKFACFIQYIKIQDKSKYIAFINDKRSKIQ